jgi:2-keto-myo-inositol isomerase
MLIGYQEGTGIFCADSTLEKDLMLCEKEGFDIIEIRFDALQNYLLTHSIRELKAFFAGSRIKPHCMGGQFIDPEVFIGKTPERNQLDKEIMTRFIAACHISQQIGEHYFLVVNHLLNAGTLTRPVDILDQDYPYSRDEVTEFTVRILRKFCSVAQDYDVSIAFEPVCGRGGSVKTMEHALEIVNETGYPNIGLCLDSFNQYINGKNNDFSIYKVLPPEKIITAHINNCDSLPLGVLAPPHRRFCDSGEIDLDNFCANLKAIGYKGPVSIEVLRPEYYAWPIEKVIHEAYRTTKELAEKYS